MGEGRWEGRGEWQGVGGGGQDGRYERGEAERWAAGPSCAPRPTAVSTGGGVE